MGGSNSDNKGLNFADVVRKIQVLDKEMLVNDILDIQKYKNNTVNLQLIEIDRIKINKAKQESYENLVMNSNRIVALVEDHSLSMIKSDILSSSDLDKIPIKV